MPQLPRPVVGGLRCIFCWVSRWLWGGLEPWLPLMANCFVTYLLSASFPSLSHFPTFWAPFTNHLHANLRVCPWRTQPKTQSTVYTLAHGS